MRRNRKNKPKVAGPIGTRAKKAAEHKREKRLDAIFAAGVGAVGYVTGHAAFEVLQPVIAHAARALGFLPGQPSQRPRVLPNDPDEKDE